MLFFFPTVILFGEYFNCGILNGMRFAIEVGIIMLTKDFVLPWTYDTKEILNMNFIKKRNKGKAET